MMSKDNLRDNRKNIRKKSELSLSNSTSFPNNKEYNSTPLNRFYTEKE